MSHCKNYEKPKPKYRVEICLGADCLSRQFNDAECAVNCYRHWARPFSGQVVFPSAEARSIGQGGETIVIRLWSNQGELLIASDGSSRPGNRWGNDPDIARALLA